MTNHGRDELVVLDAAEYERLWRLDTRVSMPVDALGEAEFRRLEKESPIPEQSRQFDHLVPNGW